MTRMPRRQNVSTVDTPLLHSSISAVDIHCNQMKSKVFPLIASLILSLSILMVSSAPVNPFKAVSERIRIPSSLIPLGMRKPQTMVQKPNLYPLALLDTPSRSESESSKGDPNATYQLTSIAEEVDMLMDMYDPYVQARRPSPMKALISKLNNAMNRVLQIKTNGLSAETLAKNNLVTKIQGLIKHITYIMGSQPPTRNGAAPSRDSSDAGTSIPSSAGSRHSLSNLGSAMSIGRSDSLARMSVESAASRTGNAPTSPKAQTRRKFPPPFRGGRPEDLESY